MSDVDKDQARAVIAAAIAAAGPKGTNEGAWKAKVNEAIPHVVSMMNESSRQWRIAEEVLTAQIFTAVYRGFVVEETSKRCVVTIETRVSKRYPDGLEPIRSHRTDNAQGKSMMERLAQLEDGDNILVFKAMEAINDETKVRVLVHFEKLPYRKDERQSAAPDSAPVGGGVGDPLTERTTTPDAPRVRPYSDSIDSERIVSWRAKTREKLPANQLEDLIVELSKQGYSYDGVSEVEWDTVVRPLIQEIRSLYQGGNE